MKHLKTSVLTLVSLLALMLPQKSLAQLSIHQLGTDNTLVRITGQAKYIIFPVQESMPDAKVDILVNGDLARTIYVRLADSKIDYTVPLDLTQYTSKGEVVLNIISEVDRTHSRDASEYVCWEEMKLTDSFDTSNKEQYRPAYHHTPLYGWMNDPNGMFFKDGTWHLYYQHNPYGSKWQNMTWGHSSSRDLVHWEHNPLAIEPNALGSIFSGSAVVDAGNTAGFGKDAVVALYTSAGHSQIQSLAYSLDGGMTFTNYPGNPVIANPREARDPNMFWHEGTGKWILVLANPLEQEMMFYSSDDLKDWTYESSFGKGYGSQYGVWECPDFFELPVAGTNKTKWVLLCNINPGGPYGGSATQYFVGEFDGHKFTCDTPSYVTRWCDYGKDHYATVSWSNAPAGRRTVIGWMSNWQYANDVPTMQFRSANTIARDLGLFRDAKGEIYLSTVPSPEIESIRDEKYVHLAANVDNGPVSYSLPSQRDGICEIELDYSLKGGSLLEISLSNEAGECVKMTVDSRTQQFSMDRSASGMVKFSRHFPVKTSAPTINPKGSGKLRIFIDRCSIEAFDGEGKFVMTNLVFPSKPYSKITLAAEGGKAKVGSVTIWSLNPEK